MPSVATPFVTQLLCSVISEIQSTPLNRVTSGPGYFDPVKRRNLLTENMLFLGYNCIFIRMLLEYEHIDSGFIIIRLTIVHNMCDTKKS